MNISTKYVKEISSQYLKIPIDIIKKDLILSYILQELSKLDELIFKGGTCLSKCYLNYHRYSEDLDFNLEFEKQSSKSKYKQKIRDYFKEIFLVKLQEISDKYNLEFDKNEFSSEGKKYCPVKSGDNIFIFYVYSNGIQIKIEINISEKRIFDYNYKKINNFSSKHLTYPLIDSQIRCYALEEIVLEKIRAILTRVEGINERDIFDLYLINKQINIFNVDIKNINSKLNNSLFPLNKKRFMELKNYKLFEDIDNLVLISFDKNEYKDFFLKLKKLIFEFSNHMENN
jgi:predicted nucleotidyltransferase component of viral defense system